MTEKLSFEAGIQELEALTGALESGEMTLEASFEAYERAVTIKRALEKLLEDGDRRIRVLTERGEEDLDMEEML